MKKTSRVTSNFPTPQQNQPDLATISIAADIVSAYVGRNALAASEVPKLIGDVLGAVLALKQGSPAVEVPLIAPIPAVPVRRSVLPDAIICLEDGQAFRSMRRHLATAHGLTAEAYREKWGLPRDYPMVAPNYSAARSALAKSYGLGVQTATGSIRGPKTQTPA